MIVGFFPLVHPSKIVEQLVLAYDSLNSFKNSSMDIISFFCKRDPYKACILGNLETLLASITNFHIAW